MLQAKRERIALQLFVEDRKSHNATWQRAVDQLSPAQRARLAQYTMQSRMGFAAASFWVRIGLLAVFCLFWRLRIFR